VEDKSRPIEAGREAEGEAQKKGHKMMTVGEYLGCKIEADVAPTSKEGTPWSWSFFIVNEDRLPKRLRRNQSALPNTPNTFPTRESAAQSAFEQAKTWMDSNL